MRVYIFIKEEETTRLRSGHASPTGDINKPQWHKEKPYFAKDTSRVKDSDNRARTKRRQYMIRVSLPGGQACMKTEQTNLINSLGIF